MVLDLILRVCLVLFFAPRVWRLDLFLPARVHSGLHGRSVPPNPKTHTRTPEACLSHPETCFSQAMKIVHFGPILAVRISGRICSENVGNPGIYYVALQLMTLRFALCSLCLSN
jgi:hypothetical protein